MKNKNKKKKRKNFDKKVNKRANELYKHLLNEDLEECHRYDKARKRCDSCGKGEVVDEVFPDVEHDIEGVTFEGKPLSAWSIDGMLNSLEKENDNGLFD